jgi:hypothetical protein
MTTYTIRPTSWIVGPSDEPAHSLRMTTIRIEDEGGGEFLVLEQENDTGPVHRIAITSDEWPILRQAIEAAFKHCREDSPADSQSDRVV